MINKDEEGRKIIEGRGEEGPKGEKKKINPNQ